MSIIEDQPPLVSPLPEPEQPTFSTAADSLKTRAIMVRVPPLIYLSLLASLMILVPTWFILRDSFDSAEVHNAKWAPGSVSVNRGGAVGAHAVLFDEAMLKGETIMPKLGNATAK